MRKLTLIFLAIFGIIFQINAQTEEELKKELGSKKDAISKLEGEAAALQAKIDALPGWKKGAFGTIGGNLTRFYEWYSQGTPNNYSGNIGITFNAFANLIREKDFWRNSLSANLNWVRLDNTDDPNDDNSFNPTTDVFNLTSLYGRNIAKNWAVSGLLEYRTTLLDNFNDPGYLDFGVGATWTPLANLVVVIHPLNYNWIFSKNDTAFESSLGAKLVADYTAKYKGVNFKSNLSGFYSYKSTDYSNWTWINSLSYNLWKGIGIGMELGLRGNKQEATNYLQKLDETVTLDNVDNEIQRYWLIGLSYSF